MDENHQSQEKNALLILIIEDDPLLAHMYDEKFRIEGFKTSVANDGETGLRLALEQHPKLILLDIMLPKDDGLSLLEKLRADPIGKDIPVIALTNKAERDDAKKAMKLGAKEYLTKAMQSPEEVVKRVKIHLGIS